MNYHLIQALKKQIKDLKMTISTKEDELIWIWRNIKNTKLNEYEVEMKMYIDECTWLKHLLDEVIWSKDPINNPDT